MNMLVAMKRVVSKFRPVKEYCECCGRQVAPTFGVPSPVWRRLSKGLQRKRYCIRCFDRALREEGVHIVWMGMEDKNA